MLKNYFDQICVAHIYRERNREVNAHSKAGTTQDLGSWHIVECNHDQGNGYHHHTFIEGLQEEQ